MIDKLPIYSASFTPSGNEVSDTTSALTGVPKRVLSTGVYVWSPFVLLHIQSGYSTSALHLAVARQAQGKEPGKDVDVP